MRARLFICLALVPCLSWEGWASDQNSSPTNFDKLFRNTSDNRLNQGMYVGFLLGPAYSTAQQPAENKAYEELQNLGGNIMEMDLNLGFRTDVHWNFAIHFKSLLIPEHGGAERSIFCPCVYAGYTFLKTGAVRWHAGPTAGGGYLDVSKNGSAEAQIKGSAAGLNLNADVLLQNSRWAGFTTSLSVSRWSFDEVNRDSEGTGKPLIWSNEPSDLTLWSMSLTFGMFVNFDI
jgi:hypothetical protein